jgi:uncharacterized 2Fe-2S/4Fe-4S cluster protein (DUF4445 family)
MAYRIRMTRDGSTILEQAREIGIEIGSVCGGKGLCGKCKVIVIEGEDALSPLSDVERDRITDDEIERGYRLACQAKIVGDVVVEIPEESAPRILIEGSETPTRLDPMVKGLVVKLPKPSFGDQKSDEERLISHLEDFYGISAVADYETLRRIPIAIRENDFAAACVIWDGRLMDIGPSAHEIYGVAVDIGTTTLVAYLVNLRSGETMGTYSMLNPQIPYGEDVMSRITYCIETRGGVRNLNQVIVDGINGTIKELCEKASIGSEKIYEICAVGNTPMHHLFLALDPKNLALAPYTPVLRRSLDVKAKKIGLKVNPNANLHLLPIIAGFVGADHVAVLLATEVYKSDITTLVIDIGTNSEIYLGNKDRCLCCSCAAGPAFEGAHIKCGMRATEGAIERFEIGKSTLIPRFKTIGGIKPKGICGSGMIDAVAEMLKTGIINHKGIINEIGNQRIRKGRNGNEYVVAWGAESSTGKDIVVTQDDIGEVQLAKAATYAGASILMGELGINSSDLDEVLLAGAFGSYIEPMNAMTIGLLPEVDLRKVKSIGNAAGIGAKKSLISKKLREEEGKITSKIEYVELAAHQKFEEEFLYALDIPHADLSLFPFMSMTL